MRPLLHLLLAVGVLGSVACGQSGGASPNDATHAIAGRVIGAGPSIVTVSLSGGATAIVSTDGEGRFRFAGLHSGSYSVTPSLDGYTFWPRRASITIRDEDAQDVEFTTEPTSTLHRLCGRIYQPPPGGAIVRLTGTKQDEVTSVAEWNEPLARSSYCFDLPDGSYTLTPSLEGATFAPAEVTVTVSGGDAIAPDLDESCTLRGTVTGVGAVGASLVEEFYCSTPHHPGPPCEQVVGTTDADGAYAIVRPYRQFFDGSQPRRYFLKRGEIHYSPERTIVDFDAHGQRRQDFESFYTISGVLHGVSLSGPLVCLGVYLSGDASASRWVCADEASYSFAVQEGTYAVEVRHDSRTVVTPAIAVVQVSGANVDQGFEVAAPTYTLLVTVAGASPAGVSVMLDGPRSATGITDAMGTLLFPGLPQGDYSVRLAAPGRIFEPTSEIARVGPSDVTLDFVGEDAGVDTHAISGQVYGPVLEGALVALSGPLHGSTVSEASGAFAFHGLVDGTYSVSASLPGYAFTRTEVTVSGADAHADLVESGPAGIWGRVASPSPFDVTVTITGPVTLTLLADERGVFGTNDLPPGQYTLTPRAPGQLFRPASLAWGPDPEPFLGTAFLGGPFSGEAHRITGQIHGRNVGGVLIQVLQSLSPYDPFAIRQLGAHDGFAWTDASGAFVVDGLPDGRYSVYPTYSWDQVSPSSQVVVLSDGDATADFEERLLVQLQGIVTSPALADVTLTVSGAGDAAIPLDSAGAFSVDLPLGTYALRASAPGQVFNPISAALDFDGPGSGGVELDGKPFDGQMHRIAGRLRGALRHVVVRARSEASGIWGEVWVNAAGEYVLDGVPDGSYTVEPVLPDADPGYVFTPSSIALDLQGSDASADFAVTGP